MSEDMPDAMVRKVEIIALQMIIDACYDSKGLQARDIDELCDNAHTLLEEIKDTPPSSDDVPQR